MAGNLTAEFRFPFHLRYQPPGCGGGEGGGTRNTTGRGGGGAHEGGCYARAVLPLPVVFLRCGGASWRIPVEAPVTPEFDVRDARVVCVPAILTPSPPSRSPLGLYGTSFWCRPAHSASRSRALQQCCGRRRGRRP